MNYTEKFFFSFADPENCKRCRILLRIFTTLILQS